MSVITTQDEKEKNPTKNNQKKKIWMSNLQTRSYRENIFQLRVYCSLSCTQLQLIILKFMSQGPVNWLSKFSIIPMEQNTAPESDLNATLSWLSFSDVRSRLECGSVVHSCSEPSCQWLGASWKGFDTEKECLSLLTLTQFSEPTQCRTLANGCQLISINPTTRGSILQTWNLNLGV